MVNLLLPQFVKFENIVIFSFFYVSINNYTIQLFYRNFIYKLLNIHVTLDLLLLQIHVKSFVLYIR
jgi:hypothetical protein